MPPDSSLDTAVQELRAGHPVVVPTDTVYGVAADPFVDGATKRLFEVKRRPADVLLAVLVASVEQARTVATVDEVAARLMDRCWPGAVTLVLPRKPGVDIDLGASSDTVGLRCPAHPVALALTARVGPLATTSANLHGEETPTTAAGVAAALGDAVDVVLDAGPLAGVPSTVVDCTGPELRVLREGPVTIDDLRAAAEGR